VKDVVLFVVNVIYILAFIGVLVAGIIAALYELIGHAKFQELLNTIGISNGFECCWKVSIILVLVLVCAHFAKVALARR
jgi:hypothetical protein